MLISLNGFGQSIKKITDKARVAQEERMVFSSWGNFLPKPKNIFGINVNPHYTLVWSWGAVTFGMYPKNKRYREGRDIRPLAPHGEQTQRMAANSIYLNTNGNFKKYSDTIGTSATNEFLNHTSVTSDVDPLWQLYYKTELKPVYTFDYNTFISKIPYNKRPYLVKGNMDKWLIEQMGVLEDRLENTKTEVMDRGSRILGYHKILMDYRAVMSRWGAFVSNIDFMLNLEKTIESTSPATMPTDVWKPGSDLTIVKDVYMKALKTINIQ